MGGIPKQEDYDEAVAQSSPHILAMSPTHGSHPSLKHKAKVIMNLKITRSPGKGGG